MYGLDPNIATYLTIGGEVFISPQYDIKWEMNEGGSCPDFLALDFSCKEVVIVEVTGASDHRPLAKRVFERQTRWFSPARKNLTGKGIIDLSWNLRFLGFVRSCNVKRLTSEFGGAQDVTFHPVECAMVLWKYWDERIKTGLPGNRRQKDQQSGEPADPGASTV